MTRKKSVRTKKKVGTEIIFICLLFIAYLSASRVFLLSLQLLWSVGLGPEKKLDHKIVIAYLSKQISSIQRIESLANHQQAGRRRKLQTSTSSH